MTDSVTGIRTAFYYDADNVLTKKAITNGQAVTPTIYAGGLYEVERVGTGTPKVTRYYMLGGKRVAMRVSGSSVPAENVTTYLHGDHLNSASLATSDAGAVVSAMRYTPYGAPRDGSLPTDRRYTGQREEAGIGLYDYNARFYDPMLGRFISPDSIVPEPGNAQAFNRYAYTLNNPMKYTDPSGHDFLDFFEGALAQSASDFTFGLLGGEWTGAINSESMGLLGWYYEDVYAPDIRKALTTDQNDDFYLGQKVAHSIVEGTGVVGVFIGGMIVGSGIDLMIGTGVISLAAAPETAGISIPVGGAVIVVEGAVVGAGVVVSAVSGAYVVYAKKHPVIRGTNGGMLGRNGSQFYSKELWSGERGMLHAENPAPGKRPGQIHFQEYGENASKWYYDPEKKIFLPDRDTGVVPPGWLNKMLQDGVFDNAIQKGLKYLGEN